MIFSSHFYPIYHSKDADGRSIQCFPTCCDTHIEGDLCGRAVRVMLRLFVKNNTPESRNDFNLDKVCCIGEFRGRESAPTLMRTFRGGELGPMLLTPALTPDQTLYMGRLVRQLLPAPVAEGVVYKGIFDFSPEDQGWQFRSRANHQRESNENVFSVTALTLAGNGQRLLSSIKHPSVIETWFSNDIFIPLAHFDSTEFRLSWSKNPAAGSTAADSSNNFPLGANYDGIDEYSTAMTVDEVNEAVSVLMNVLPSGNNNHLKAPSLHNSNTTANQRLSQPSDESSEGLLTSQLPSLSSEIPTVLPLPADIAQDEKIMAELGWEDLKRIKSNAKRNLQQAMSKPSAMDPMEQFVDQASTLNQLLATVPVMPCIELNTAWLENVKDAVYTNIRSVTQDANAFNVGFHYELPVAYDPTATNFFPLLNKLCGNYGRQQFYLIARMNLLINLFQGRLKFPIALEPAVLMLLVDERYCQLLARTPEHVVKSASALLASRRCHADAEIVPMPLRHTMLTLQRDLPDDYDHVPTMTVGFGPSPFGGRPYRNLSETDVDNMPNAVVLLRNLSSGNGLHDGIASQPSFDGIQQQAYEESGKASDDNAVMMLAMVADYFDKYHFEENRDEYQGKQEAPNSPPIIESQDSSSTSVLTRAKRSHDSNVEEEPAAENHSPDSTVQASPAKKRRTRSRKAETN